VPLTPRFQAPVDDPNGKLGEISRVVDALAPQQAFAPIRAATASVSAGETRRVAPRSGGTVIVIPPADATNYGALITLLVDGSIGTCKVKPISGTVNGAASFTLAAGYQSLLVLMSDGEGRWLTERAEGYPLTNGDKGDITVSGDGDVWNIDAGAVGTTEIAADAVTTAKILDANVTAAKIADASLLPAKTAPAAASIGITFDDRRVFTAGVAGTADDVTIYNADAPFAFRIVDVKVLISTAVGGSTVQLRDTSGGGGSALSSALSSAATGTVRNNDTASRLVSANGSVFLRRSDRGVAGEVIFTCRRA
jgi:hypothetical protein